MGWWSKKSTNNNNTSPNGGLPYCGISVCGGIAVNEYYWKVIERKAKLEKIKKSLEDEK